MSNATETSVRVVKESQYGVTPNNPAFQTVPVNSSGLTYTPTTVQSNRLNPRRNIADLILVGITAGGELPFELSYGAFDMLIEAALFSAWANKTLKEGATEITAADATTDAFTTTAASPAWALGMLVRASGFTNAGNNGLFKAQAGSTSTSLAVPTSPGLTTETPGATARLKTVGFECASGDCVAAAGAENSLTISATSGSFASLGLAAGQWVKVGGAAVGTRFNTAANNDWCRILSVSATKLAFDVVPTGWAADTGTGKTIRIWIGDVVRNSVTPTSFTIEEVYDDLPTDKHQYYRGMMVDALNFETESEAILEGSVSFLGKDVLGPQTARLSGATTVAAPAGQVLNSSSNVGRIGENGTPIVGPNFVLSGSIAIANSLRKKPAVGSLSGVGVGSGLCEVTLELETYFGDGTMLNKLRNNTETSYDNRWVDPNGTRALVLDVPRVKYGEGNVSNPGNAQDRTLPITGKGIEYTPADGAATYTVQFQRFDEFESTPAS